MYLYSLLACVGIVVGGMITHVTTTIKSDLTRNEANAIAGNMMVYRNYVVPYSQANPSITGNVADTSLGLPTWFNRNSAVLNYVSGGKGYVYYAVAKSDLSYQILKGMNNSIKVGIKVSGNLINPLDSSTPIVLPSAIPDGSVVIAP